jgi:hypothetical protein
VSPAVPQQYQHRSSLRQGVIAAYLSSKPLSQSVVYQEAKKGLPPLRTQGSPLHSDPLLRCRCEVDTPLTSFTPLLIKQVSGFLRKPCLAIFLFLSTSIFEVRPLRTPLFAFLLGWCTFPQSWRSGFGQAYPTTGGHPKGLGLEGSRGASYAFDVPANQKRVGSSLRNKR